MRSSFVRSSLVALVCAVAACDCGGKNLKQTHPLLTVDPGSLDFGTLFVGKSATLALTVRNDGGGPLTIASVQIADDARHAFALADAAPTSLAIGASAELHLTYSAKAPDGTDLAHLVIQSDSDNGADREISLVGKSTSVCPGGANETACGDGQDNDCDGQIDCADTDCAQTPACKPSTTCPANDGELRVSDDALDSGSPLLLWNGSEFALMWTDSSKDLPSKQDYFFARLSNATAPLSGPTRVTSNGTIAHWPSFVWTGSEYGLAWSDVRNGANDVYFQRLSASGQPVGNQVQIFGDAGSSFPASIAWNPRDQEYAITWGQTSQDNQQVRELTFVRAGTDGTLRGAPVPETHLGADVEYPQLVWTGSFFGGAWSDTRDGNMRAYYRRFDANGLSQQQDTVLSPNATLAWNTTIAWNGQGFGVAWTESRANGNVVVFQRLDAQGKQQGDQLVVGEGNRPSLVWNGSGWAIAYSSKRGSDPDQIFLSRLTDAGARMGGEQRVTCHVSHGYSPSLAWNGSEYGLSWADDRNGRLEVFFKLVPASP